MASHSAKVNFLKGALIIALANLIVKVLGAAFKIPLARFVLGPDGMGIYNTAYSIYNWLFVISTAGLPVAISKLVSESIARRRYAEAGKVFRVSRAFLMAIGFLFSAALFFGAKPLADFFKSPSAYESLLAMAPSLFFVGILSAYRGYFQGMQNMLPTAGSELFEAVGKLFIGLTLGMALLPMGKEMASAGAIVGVTSGTVLGALLLVIYAVYHRKKTPWFYIQKKGEDSQAALQILKKLIAIAVPITLGTSFVTLANMIDVYMIKERLMSLGWPEMLRDTWYGYYSGYAVTLFNLPMTVVIALSVSAVPAISAAMAVYHQNSARRLTESVLRVTVLFASPCAFGLLFFAGPILELLYADGSAAQLLQALSITAISMSLVTITNSILQAAGRMWLPVIHTVIGCVFKVFLNYFLVGLPAVNILGAPIATNVCYAVIMVLNLLAVKRVLGVRYPLGDFAVKPLVSGVFMGGASYFLYLFLLPLLGKTWALFVAVGAAVVLFFACLFAVKGLKREDLGMMPGGEKIVFLLDKMKILK